MTHVDPSHSSHTCDDKYRHSELELGVSSLFPEYLMGRSHAREGAQRRVRNRLVNSLTVPSVSLPSGLVCVPAGLWVEAGERGEGERQISDKNPPSEHQSSLWSKSTEC